MKKKTVCKGALLAVFGIAALMLTGCSTIGGMIGSLFSDPIKDMAYIVNPDGTVTLSEQALRNASGKATSKATSQKTEQYADWELDGYDFQYDYAALNRGIQAGDYQLGDVINNVGVRRTASLGGGNFQGRFVNSSIGNYTPSRIEEYLIDPSKPASYRPVYLKVYKTRTVYVVDQAKYQTEYQKGINDETKQKKTSFASLKNLVDLADDQTVTVTSVNPSTSQSGLYSIKITPKTYKGKQIKAKFAKQLAALPPGATIYIASTTMWMDGAGDIVTGKMVNGAPKWQYWDSKQQ